MLKALPSIFPNLAKTSNSARDEFYNKFQRAADEYDRDFIKKYDEDLNTTLIFVGVFYGYLGHCVNLMFFRGDRPAFFPLSRPLSVSTFKATSNQITKK